MTEFDFEAYSRKTYAKHVLEAYGCMEWTGPSDREWVGRTILLESIHARGGSLAEIEAFQDWVRTDDPICQEAAGHLGEIILRRIADGETS